MRKIKDAFLIFFRMKNWLCFILEICKFTKPKELVYLFRNGAKFKVRSEYMQLHVLKEVFIQEIYTPKGFEIRLDDTVIDIGRMVDVFRFLLL